MPDLRRRQFLTLLDFDFLATFFSRYHTGKGASDYRVPRRSCSARFNASIWNGFLRVGRSR
jgi:hypothetical protein